MRKIAACEKLFVILLASSSLISATPNSGYIRDTHGATVVVFVHGIFGTGETTWNCAGSQSWPRLLLADPAFKAADVYVANYPTPYLGNRMTIDEIAANLKNRFDADGVFSRHQQIVFVAHSMGGLIVQRYLLTYRGDSSKVSFIYFFATPHTGAEVAKLGRAFSADPLLKEMLPGNQNDYLLNLESEWRNAGFGNIKRYCAYETRSYPHLGAVIVDRLSGTRSCDAAIPINADHVSIVKPCTQMDDSYIALLNAWNGTAIPSARAADAKRGAQSQAPPKTAGKSKADSPSQPPTLQSLFKDGFQNTLRVDGNNWGFKRGDIVTISGPAKVYLDFEAKNKFISFYIPHSEYSYTAALGLWESVAPTFASVEKQVAITGGYGSNPTNLKDLTFSGRVFLYHEDQFDLRQLADLLDVYKMHGMAVDFRGPDFLANQLIAWHSQHDAKHR